MQINTLRNALGSTDTAGKMPNACRTRTTRHQLGFNMSDSPGGGSELITNTAYQLNPTKMAQSHLILP